jgi:GDPmannose 4,6-dehydratase
MCGGFKRALGIPMNFLVLGASGQTGSYLAQILEANPNNKVFSASRGVTQVFTPRNFVRLDPKLGSLNLTELIQTCDADVVINLISLSSVFECERDPASSEALNYGLVKDLSSAVLQAQETLCKPVLLFQCSSSEMYSNFQPHSVISEDSDLNPGTTYGKHKAQALTYLRNMSFINSEFNFTSGILFNHESPRRSSNFVSKKIINGAREISMGRLDFLELGDISVERDWSYAPDFAEGIASLTQARITGEFVFASGELHSIDEFCELAFKFFGIDHYKSFLRINADFLRKNNNNGLIGDASKLRRSLNWSPTVDFTGLVKIMATE